MQVGAPPARELQDPVDQLLLDRVRAGVWTLILATAVLAVGELVLYPLERPLLSVAQWLSLLVLTGLLVQLRQATTQRAVLRVAVLSVTTACLTSAAIGVVMRTPSTSRFMFVAISMGAASLIPWGSGVQCIVVTILALTYAVETSVITGGFPWSRSREFLEVSVVLATSVYIAYEFARYRRLAATERLERLRHEQEIEHQRAFLRQVIDMNPHYIFARDRAGRFTLANQAAADVYGHTADALIGKTDAELNPYRDEAERFHRDDLAVIDSRTERVIPEEVITDARGQRRWLRTVKRPILDASGRAEQVLGVATDITEARRAAQQLQEEAEIGATLARIGQDIIASLTGPAPLDRLCQLATEALGYDFAQLWLWQSDDDTFVATAHYRSPPDQWEAVRVLRVPRALIEEHMLNAASGDDVVVADASHGIVPALERLTPGLTRVINIVLRRAGEVRGSLSVVAVGADRPYTARHERIGRGLSQLASLALENALLLDQLERANRLKSEFMATMSHELRTPLNVIIGYNALMLDGEMGPPTPAQLESMQRVDENARQLLDLINATLDVSRLEAGDVPLDIRRVALQTIVEEIDASTRSARDKATAQFAWQLPAEPLMLQTDATKLKVILTNLISNALKFTPAGQVTAHVAARGEALDVTVSDTGIGLAPEAQARIFEPFRQADTSIGQQYGGVGLGLYIVRRLVEALGGTVTVESAVGHGSAFRVHLPQVCIDVTNAPAPRNGAAVR